MEMVVDFIRIDLNKSYSLCPHTLCDVMLLFLLLEGENYFSSGLNLGWLDLSCPTEYGVNGDVKILELRS